MNAKVNAERLMSRLTDEEIALAQSILHEMKADATPVGTVAAAAPAGEGE